MAATAVALSITSSPALAAVGGPGVAASSVSVPDATVSQSLYGRTEAPLGSPLSVAGTVAAPGGGLLASLGGLVGSLLDSLLQPLSGVRYGEVALELQSANGWGTYSTTRTDAAGNYALSIPTNSFGSRTWRVRTAATATSGATSTEPFTVAVPTNYKAAGSATSYRLLSGGRARWNPCQPVPYYVNRSGMPKGALRVISQALARVSQASGLEFVYAGKSSGVPFRKTSSRNGMPGYGFTIAWTTPSKVKALRGSTVAVSGSWSKSVILSPTPTAQYFAGGLVIDKTAKLKTSIGKGKTLGYVVMHEVGHLVGLDHTSSRSQVMSTKVTRSSKPVFGAGDLAGFAAVGLGRGCLDG